MSASVGGLLGTLGLDSKGFLDSLGKADHAVTDSAKTQEGAFGSVGGSIDGIGKALAGLGIAGAITKFGSDAIEVATKVGKLHAGFVGLNGATEETEQLFTQIADMELASSFDFEDSLGPAAKQLLQAGVNAKDTAKYMQTIVDTAAGLKLPGENIEGIAAAFGKMTKETEVSTKSLKALESEGVPATKLLADAMGKEIPEVMDLIKKGAISSKDAIVAITEGMDERFGGAAQKSTKTWKGAMNQLDQATESVMETIGKTIMSTLDAAAPILTMIVGLVQKLSDWFKELPGPIKTAMVVFGGLIAGIAAGAAAWASFTAVMGPIVTVLGTVAAALSWPVVAIAALTAALVAFGVWVYANWEPIVAVITEAWSMVSEAWLSVWNPIVKWLSDAWGSIKELWHSKVDPFILRISQIWDAVGAYFAAAWDAISEKLNAVWAGLAEAGTKVWEFIVSGIQKFLDFASKIPGVGGLLNTLRNSLEGTSSGLKKMGTAFDSGTSKIKGLGNTWDVAKAKSDAAKKATEENTKAQEANAEATDESTVKLKAHATAQELSKAKTEADNEAKKEHKRLVEAEIAQTKMRTEHLVEYIGTVKKENDIQKERMIAYTQSMVQMKYFAITLDDEVTPALVDTTLAAVNEGAAVAQLQKPMFDAESAMKRLGITSTETFNQTALDAEAAYKAISGSGTKWETDNAMLRMLKAQQDAARANNTTLTTEQLATLKTLETQLGDSATKQQGMWGNMATSVSTVITNFAQDLSKSLWDGDMSWGEKGKKMLKDLGQAVTSSFVEPATKALGEFITGTLTDLMGDKGFGGIGGLLGSLGSKIGGLLGGGGGSDLAVDAGGAAISKLPLDRIIPGLGDVAGSVTKTVSSTASSVMKGVMGSVMGVLNPISAVANVVGSVAQVLSLFGVGKGGEMDRLNNIANDTRFIAWCFDTGRVYLNIWDIRNAAQNIDAHLASIDNAMSSQADRAITIQISPQGLTTAEAARALGNQIAANLTGQLVAV